MSSSAADSSSSLEHNARFMDQYSRQIGAFGLETMAKLVKLRVLIVGLHGLGVEAAKNLILAGPGGVTLLDDGATAIEDLGANFFLTEDDVRAGRSRADACVKKLQELNTMVAVQTATGGVTEELVGAHDVVLMTNQSLEEQQRVDELCRAAGTRFIATAVLGAFGTMFVDFGDAFAVHDGDGENPVVRVITNIVNAEDGTITLDSEGRVHGIDVSDDHTGWVKISGVEGMDRVDGRGSINTDGPFRVRAYFRNETRNGKAVRVFDSHRLVIGDTRVYTPYVRGGVMTQAKVPYKRSFRPLAAGVTNPGDLPFTDGAKFGRGEQLHLAYRAINAFAAAHGALPEPHNEEQANEVVALAKRLNADGAAARSAAEGKEADALSLPLVLEDVDEDVVRRAALFAAVELQPLAALFGGMAAQEVVKSTGKFTPLNQFLYLDFFEALPDRRPEDCSKLGGRYDHVVAMYGRAFLERLFASRTFLVGCGALGCEFLKSFAMVGLACGEGGLVTVTDNDRIEVSNLNRQFLFREHNVGQPKSVAASAAVKAMNPAIQVRTLETLVAPHTETVFDNAFWESLHFVTNALDNVKARLYVDQRCVFFGKPLLESGTLGTKCNVQVVLPHKTESYGDQKDAEDEENIPMCTLRNFPSLIDHCIEWARALFTDLFVAPMAEARKFVANKPAFLDRVREETLGNPSAGLAASNMSKAMPVLQEMKRSVELARGASFERCIELAYRRFHELFRDRILDLTHQFPADYVDEKTQEPFWSGAKRFPTPITFDPADPTHMGFLLTAANLYAVAFGLQPAPAGPETLVPLDSPLRDVARFEAVVRTLSPHEWAPSGKKLAARDEEAKGEDEVDRAAFEALLNELAELDVSGLTFEPADFEKDQDLNFHIDFITAAANTRAINYRIETASRHSIKMVAGKIIPAIATTTAAVVSLVMLELLKLLQGKELDAFRNSSNNLGLNMYLFSEPMPPKKAQDEYDPEEMAEVKCKPPGFTKWDKTLIEAGDLTLREFLDEFKRVTGLNCTMLYHAVALLEDKEAQEAGRSVQGLFLYNRDEYSPANRELYARNMDSRLVDWIRERYEREGGLTLIQPTRSHVELKVACADDDGAPYKVPSVVYKFK